MATTLFCVPTDAAYADNEIYDFKTILRLKIDNIIQEIEKKEQELCYQNKLNTIVDTASQYIGVPYVWGGISPSGFDCSGLTQYVYGECGISLPRVVAQQINVGYSVSFDNLQKGDLLFWGNYHVAIYIGDGQYIHAPEPGQSVTIQSMSYYYPTSARRIVDM